MPNALDGYSQSSVDWRNTLRQNTFKTRMVIAIFFLVYASIGLLVDIYISSARYPDASLLQIAHAYLTLQLFPFVTLIMLVIASISLLITYSMYDKLMLLGTEYHEVTPQTARNISEKQLYNTIEEMKISAGLRYMPRVFVIEANYMNAFASGYSEKSAMVAITKGLMDKLTRDEMQAVMAHELSHIRHMDIKLTLTASILANLTIMVLDLLFRNAIYSSGSRSSNNDQSRNSLIIIIMVLRFALPIINIFLLLYLSRTRELMADAGCVELMRDNKPLANALLKIAQDHQDNQTEYAAAYQNTPHEQVRLESYIFDPTEAGIKSLSTINDLISTHPNLDTRLNAIGFKKRSSTNNP